MENQEGPGSSHKEEIDLRQLLGIIRRGFNSIFKGILRIFIFLKRNAIKLGALILIGVAVGLLLNSLIGNTLKTEVIVRPNFDSKDYLYDVINEIQANIIAKDTTFFNSIGIAIDEIKGVKIAIEPIEEELGKDELDNNLRFISVLQNFQDQTFVQEVLKSELFKKSIPKHRITCIYKDASTGPRNVEKILNYLNDNSYFKELGKISLENASMRIVKNEELITQLDALISNYTKSLAENKTPGEGNIYLNGESSLNVPSLFSIKNRLIKEIEEKKIELREQNNIVGIVNVGKPQIELKPFFNKRLVSIPMYLLLAFFAISLIQYLNRKAKEIQ